MKRLLTLSLFSIAALLLQTGCVVGRRTVALSVPPAAVAAEVTKGDLRIASVVDQRVFENKPSDPSTPSIDGDVGEMSAAVKDTMIGRQRNGYGKAMGDIALPSGDSVSERARAVVEQGLRQHGYRISTATDAATSAEVAVDEFWAWFSPGFMSVGFEARVYCTLTLRKADKSATVVIKGYGENRGQIASDANWQLAYERAFTDFLAKIGPELDQAGF